MLAWIMGNLCEKSDRDEAPQEPVEIPQVSRSVTAGNSPQALVHNAAINCLARIGNNLLSGCKDGNLALYDCSGRTLLARVPGAHTRETTALAANSSENVQDSRRVLCASASRDKSLRLWLPPPTAGELAPAGSFIDAHELVVSAIDFNSLDCNQLVTGSRDNCVKLWDAASQKQVGSASVSRNLVTHIKWAPGSHQFLQASEDKELKLWDSRTLKVVGVFPRKQYIQTCCDVSPDGSHCVSSSNGFGGNGCEATVWDVRTKKLLLELIGHAESVLSVQYHGALVCTGAADATVRLWEPSTGKELACLPLDGAGPINAIQSLPALGLVAAGTFNSGVQLCNVTDTGLAPNHRY